MLIILFAYYGLWIVYHHLWIILELLSNLYESYTSTTTRFSVLSHVYHDHEVYDTYMQDKS